MAGRQAAARGSRSKVASDTESTHQRGHHYLGSLDKLGEIKLSDREEKFTEKFRSQLHAHRPSRLAKGGTEFPSYQGTKGPRKWVHLRMY